MGIRPVDELDDSFEANDFGTIFHRAAEDFYNEIKKRCPDTISGEVLKEYIDNPALLYKFVDDAFKEEYFKGNKPIYNGEQYINRGVIHHFLLRLIKMDTQYTPFRYIAAEKKIFAPYAVNVNNTTINLNIGGTIDRIDIKGDTINIVDYKTGGGDDIDTKTSLEKIFNLETSSAGYRLQAFLYSVVMNNILSAGTKFAPNSPMSWINSIENGNAYKISPSLLYVNKKENAQREDFIVQLDKDKVKDITTLKKMYLQELDAVLEEIFDVNKSFMPAKDCDKCKYCDYKKLCKR